MLKNSRVFWQPLIMMVFLGLLVLCSIMIFTVNLQITEIKDTTRSMQSRYLEKNLEILGNEISSIMENTFREVQLLGELSQFYLDHEEEFSGLTVEMKGNSYFRDHLEFNGRWYQNGSDEPMVVNVTRFLLEENDQIGSDVQWILDHTLFMDWVFPVFFDYGSPKNLLYFKGGDRMSISRITPWYDIGGNMDEIYPAFVDTPIWDTFFPGMIDGWSEWLENPDLHSSSYGLALASSPVQDGATGELAVTFRYPLWSRDRSRFLGNIGFDVLIEDVIELIESDHPFATGYAFLTQSNGNLFAINEKGAEILGFGPDSEYWDITGEGAGFNDMKRMLNQSDYESVHNLDQYGTAAKILIGHSDYYTAVHPLDSFVTWNRDKGFFSDHWNIGIVVSAEEFEREQNDLVNQSVLFRNLNIGMVIFILLILLSWVILRLRSEKTEDAT